MAVASSTAPETGHAHEATSAAIAAELLNAPVAAQATDTQPVQATQTPLPGMLASVPASKPPQTPVPVEERPHDTREVSPPVRQADTTPCDQPELLLPKALHPEWHDAVRQTLLSAPQPVRQQLLDELEGQLGIAGKTIANPPGYLQPC